jgi:hypothetical protein
MYPPVAGFNPTQEQNRHLDFLFLGLDALQHVPKDIDSGTPKKIATVICHMFFIYVKYTFRILLSLFSPFWGLPFLD